MDRYKVLRDCPGLEAQMNTAANEGFRLKEVIGKTVIMERYDYGGMTVGVTILRETK